MADTATSQTRIEGLIDSYLEENWEAMVADIEELVRIPSFEEPEKACAGAPFGPGPAAALEAGLAMGGRLGLATHEGEGYLGIADLPGSSDTQIGIICHLDVVPAGSGWTVEPYALTRRDGYLLGRGTLDDKGPFVVALHALAFWKGLQDAGEAPRFPYTVRFIMGANEETDLRDVEYFHEHYADPAFLFTPDAEFPVCYGEKGGYDATIRSAALPEEARVVVDMQGGDATNAVPGEASALVRADAAGLQGTDAVSVEAAGEGLARIRAAGKSAHASTPEQGVNAIGVLVGYLLDNGLCSGDERPFLEFERRLLSRTDGSGIGIQSEDAYFGPLTVIGGTVRMEDGSLVQTIDSRFPTSIDGEGIGAALARETAAVGATFENTLLLEPFLVDPESPQIQALLAAYNEATGEDAKPFTMGGGTYAREFASGASFGPEKPWEENPAWVGTMHGPDEGISEELLRQAFKIYALTIHKLMALDLR